MGRKATEKYCFWCGKKISDNCGDYIEFGCTGEMNYADKECFFENTQIEVLGNRSREV